MESADERLQVMELQEYLDGGDLAGAIASGIAAVKADPTNTDLRYQLFAVLCFAGDLHKARKQLGAMDIGDPELSRVQGVYINLLASEKERLAVFHHGAEPLLPPDPPVHLKLRLEALKASSAGDHDRADDLVSKALEDQPEISGTINGERLAAVRDMDDILGSSLEVFVGGRYLWLPFERIAKLKIEPPRQLLDLIWLPAEVTDIHDSTSWVYVPVLYESSSKGEDPRAATGRITEWYNPGGDQLRGRGQRVLGWAPESGDAEEISILELRTLKTDTAG